MVGARLWWLQVWEGSGWVWYRLISRHGGCYGIDNVVWMWILFGSKRVGSVHLQVQLFTFFCNIIHFFLAPFHFGTGLFLLMKIVLWSRIGPFVSCDEKLYSKKKLAKIHHRVPKKITGPLAHSFCSIQMCPRDDLTSQPLLGSQLDLGSRTGLYKASIVAIALLRLTHLCLCMVLLKLAHPAKIHPAGSSQQKETLC